MHTLFLISNPERVCKAFRQLCVPDFSCSPPLPATAALSPSPTGGGEHSPGLQAHSLSGSTTLLFHDCPRAYSMHFVTNLSPSSNNTAVSTPGVQVLQRASQFLPPISDDSAAPSAPPSPTQPHPGQHDCDKLKHTVNFQMKNF